MPTLTEKEADEVFNGEDSDQRYQSAAKNIIGIVLDEINNKLDEEVKRLFETDEYKIAAGVRYAQSIIREMKPTSALRRGEVA